MNPNTYDGKLKQAITLYYTPYILLLSLKFEIQHLSYIVRVFTFILHFDKTLMYCSSSTDNDP